MSYRGGRVSNARSMASNVRVVLRQAPDGMKAKEIAKHLQARTDSVRAALTNSMDDAYVDRWEPVPNNSGRGKPATFEAVWCVVPVPANCPHPRSDA